MDDIKNKWVKEEWEKFEKKLESLSVEELKEIADATGLRFFADNIRKEDYINALDESNKEDLLAEYERIISRKTKEQNQIV